MPDITINGVIITFPFKPYPVQEEYMAKVIECLQNSKHGVLESPTGTGKTLSLLCSSLSWLLTKKAQLQAQAIAGAVTNPDFGGHFFNKLTDGLEKAAGVPDQSASFGWAMPKIIYASRTHSQLSQAMQELKRTSYKHVQVAVIGSRDQLCIHPEVSKETNTFHKIQMCHSKVKARTCFYYNNVEAKKEDPIFKQEVLDIEDLMKAGQKMKCCPYFMSKELKQNADITFMPYNYLLDPKTRKSQGIDLQNNVILLDEAHNVEKTCEEAASLQISSTDVAMCIDEITAVMKDMADNADQQIDFSMECSTTVPKDFTPEDLCILKTMFLNLEKVIDSIEIKKSEEGETFPGGYIFELLEKAELTHGKDVAVAEKIDKIILYLSTNSNSPFSRKGNALQKFSDLLKTVFSSGVPTLHRKERIKECYKVHIQAEQQKKTYKADGWETKKSLIKNDGKLISYWCFSPGFGMQQLIEQGVRSVILTSGTLSPLRPFVSELGIPIDVQLENPHIVKGQQICVGILSEGPDGHPLNSSFNTRNDPQYIASLGRTIYNFSCLIPHGLLVFFPSYPIMKKCRDDWQQIGLWTKIAERKPIYVEPQSKDGFINVMNEYYQKIQDPSCRGAIFMAVCRGKVSEGLDFADANGRAVLVTGLPFPPLKDPRVVLKQRYLEEMRVKDKESLSGQQWYQLEASRAVNQAIGRIIRHQNDYGAIILCDCRFNNPSFKQQLSAWIRPHIKQFKNFGIVTKELREFFRYTEKALPQPKMSRMYNKDDYSLPAVPATFDQATCRKAGSKLVTNTAFGEDNRFDIEMYTSETVKIDEKLEPKKKLFSDPIAKEEKPVIKLSTSKPARSYVCSKLTKDSSEPAMKKRKLRILPVEFNPIEPGPSTEPCLAAQNFVDSSRTKQSEQLPHNDIQKKSLGKTYLKDVKQSLSDNNYRTFGQMIQDYTRNGNFDELLKTLNSLFPLNGELQHLFIGFKSFVKKQHIKEFNEHVMKLTNTLP